MTAEPLREIFRVAAHVGLGAIPELRAGVDAVLPLLERMRAEGAVVVLKLDGQRVGIDDNGPYTALISGGRLVEGFARTDAASLEEAVAKVVAAPDHLRPSTVLSPMHFGAYNRFATVRAP